MTRRLVVCCRWHDQDSTAEAYLAAAARVHRKMADLGAEPIAWSAEHYSFTFPKSSFASTVRATLELLQDQDVHGVGIADRELTRDRFGRHWGEALALAETLAASTRHGEALVDPEIPVAACAELLAASALGVEFNGAKLRAALLVTDGLPPGSIVDLSPLPDDARPTSPRLLSGMPPGEHSALDLRTWEGDDDLSMAHGTAPTLPAGPLPQTDELPESFRAPAPPRFDTIRAGEMRYTNEDSGAAEPLATGEVRSDGALGSADSGSRPATHDASDTEFLEDDLSEERASGPSSPGAFDGDRSSFVASAMAYPASPLPRMTAQLSSPPPKPSQRPSSAQESVGRASTPPPKPSAHALQRHSTPPPKPKSASPHATESRPVPRFSRIESLRNGEAEQMITLVDELWEQARGQLDAGFIASLTEPSGTSMEDGLQRLQQALEGHVEGDMAERSGIALAYAVCLAKAGKPAEALLESLQALATARRSGDAQAERASELMLAQLARYTGQPELAERWLKIPRQLERSSG